ncbi:MAG TPA: acetyl-CoA carboxylase biotin carboxylase subunit [Candidatus Acidoferrales bacterium]|nr:acetyl-CoA carboxylase biotin carboxylase subunit [Candidatus Acidoferrales bacterium]
MFKRILVANRGEIALRVIRACRELGIGVVTVYSDADRDALHVREADEAIHLGPTPPAQSYLNVERILDAARQSSCDAIHPGYGFLAENSGFARATAERGLTFIGPSPAAMERMGDKLSARAVAVQAGVPVVPGTHGAAASAKSVLEAAERLGYPIAIKASAGGGGKGLRVAASPAEVETALSLASKEAAAYFADGTVYVERYLPHPKHVEVQVLGDRHGGAVHFGERDCSMQRRHQKLVEETPATIGAGLRRRMHEAAVSLVRTIGYDSAGTIECLVEGDEFYFLEMNARIQVEHTITEATYGFDLVKAQIRIASGEPLWFSQAELVPRGHAIECRINAESPVAAFAPSPGRIARYLEPGGPGIRIDGAAFAGATIGSDYDSLVAKLVSWGADREEARRRMLRALGEYAIDGIETTIPFYRLLLEDEGFRSGAYSTAMVEAFVKDRAAELDAAYSSGAPANAASPAERPADLTVEVNDRQFRVRVFGMPNAGAALPRARSYQRSRGVSHGGSDVVAPMHGIIAEIRVQPGEKIEPGQVVAVVEAMKMMNEVIAQRAGAVQSVHVVAGQTVEAGTPLVSFANERAV